MPGCDPRAQNLQRVFIEFGEYGQILPGPAVIGGRLSRGIPAQEQHDRKNEKNQF